jgi:hypothetical protein
MGLGFRVHLAGNIGSLNFFGGSKYFFDGNRAKTDTNGPSPPTTHNTYPRPHKTPKAHPANLATSTSCTHAKLAPAHAKQSTHREEDWQLRFWRRAPGRRCAGPAPTKVLTPRPPIACHRRHTPPRLQLRLQMKGHY